MRRRGGRFRWQALALVLALAAGALAAAGPEVAAEVRGAALIAPFKQALQSALRDGLARGPLEAIDACRVRAPELAHEASRGSVAAGRTSHRLRNVANAPREWVKPLLESYLDEPRGTGAAVALGEGRSGYVEPIFVQPPCLVCHGEAIAEPLRARLAELYPDDRAIGFRAGDFRGLFWVEFGPTD
jgi:hypothetical protein